MSLPAFLASKDNVMKLYEGKMPVATIAKLYRIKEVDVRKALRKWRMDTMLPHEVFLEDKDAVIKAFDSGMSRTSIASTWGVSISTVNKHLERWGYPQREPPTPPDVNTLRAMIEMRNEGATYKAIGEAFGVSETTASHHCKKALRMGPITADEKILLLPQAPKGLRGMEPGDTVRIGQMEYVFIESRKRVGGRLWMFRAPWGALESFTEWQLRDGKPVIVKRGSGETADVVCG